MIKLKSILTEITTDDLIPEFLYHATFDALAKEIESVGLIPNGNLFKNFEDIETGVYLANSPGIAESMVESSENENIPEEWFGEIVVLKIKTGGLDMQKFGEDPNVTFDEYSDAQSFIYRGNIPPENIVEIK